MNVGGDGETSAESIAMLLFSDKLPLRPSVWQGLKSTCCWGKR